jgi:hypothetical protein
MEQTQWHETGGHRIWTLTHTIDSNSLSVNEDIPDEVFTMPMHMIRSYEDADDRNQYFSTERVIDEGVENLRPSDSELVHSNQVHPVTRFDTATLPERKTAVAATPAEGGQQKNEGSNGVNVSVIKYIYVVALITVLGGCALLYRLYRRRSGS